MATTARFKINEQTDHDRNTFSTMTITSPLQQLTDAAQHLSAQLGGLVFGPPVTHVYNPLDYAWPLYAAYLRRYANSRKPIVFLGMNPGPFGMVQTGIPFGEIDMVTRWLGLQGKVGKPALENPARPVEGFACPRSEVSGRRLWGLFESRFGHAERFAEQHFVANYCPLAFFDQGRNLTPDKLPSAESAALLAACDQHLQQLVAALEPDWVVGIGAWAEKRARLALHDKPVKIARILHPSPASPAANRGWAEAATAQLEALGIW